jgi:hypothetical protein
MKRIAVATAFLFAAGFGMATQASGDQPTCSVGPGELKPISDVAQGNDVLELVDFIQDNPQDASDAAELMADKATRHDDILSDCATAN